MSYDSWGGGGWSGQEGGQLGGGYADTGGYADFGGMFSDPGRLESAVEAQALGPQASMSETNRAAYDAAINKAKKQNPHNISSYITGLLSTIVTRNPMGLLKPGAAFLGTMSARNKASDAAINKAAADLGVTKEQAMGLMGLDFSGPDAGFDRGSNTEPGTVGQYGQGFSGDTKPYDSPLAQLIQNSIAGLNPTPQQGQTQSPQNTNPLWNALIPTLQIRGETLGETLLANPNFPAYTQTGGIV